MESQTLRRASIYHLYEGMYIEEDICASESGRLLLRAGVVLTDELLSKIRANSSGGYIYVSNKTYKKMIENADKQTSRQTAINRGDVINKELEKQTGYAADMEDTTGLLLEIANTASVKEEQVYSVCDNIARRVRSTDPGVIFKLINSLAPVDEYLQRHVVNVGMLNGLLGKWLNMPQMEVDDLILIGLLHDCGKVMIPPEILNAPRRLTPIEFEVIKMHTVYSYKILEAFPEHIRLGALHHHEKLGGKGYTNSLAGERIPLAARITSVSDIYDAMVSRRAYKDAAVPSVVLTSLLELRGTDLDAEIVDCFVKNKV